MSLPLQLQSIKSSGVYRFVYDKSVISGQTAETLRLLVGYSDKGPFNTPVYITTRDEFINTYGNISKRLEKKGIYFHRLALQALAAGPILCLNLKNFTTEAVKYTKFDASGAYGLGPVASTTKNVTALYNTNRFWTLNAEDLVDDTNYIVISATDTVDASCSIIIRKAVPEEYDLTIREWYAGVTDEMPDYLEPVQDDKLNNYFADVYVFRGEFTKELCGNDGPLGRYFNVRGAGTVENPTIITLKEDYVDAFGEPADVLTALANDPASNYIAGYRGTTIPFFKNTNGSYISLDLLFNGGYSEHKMLMNMNESLLSGDATALRTKLVIPELDTTNHDMENDVDTYYGRQVTEDDPVKYYYTTIVSPTAAQKKKAVDVTTAPTNVDAASAKTAAQGGDLGEIIKYTAVTTPSITPLYIAGFTYAGTPSAENSLNVITGDYGKGLQEALTNRVDVEYHYLVDTFDTAITNNKTTLAALARKKDNCFAILNFPKIKDYLKEGSTYKTNNTLDFKKVIAVFNLPDDVDGASWVGYFTQIVLSDGTVRSTVPSAGLVSNLFMDKWTARQPYYIVAGSQYGRLLERTLVGPDYGFSKSDRDVLEPFGINVIVYEPRRGTYINSEQTAKQVPVSALSKIHIRELVIYLQDEIAELLETYRWELNTQVLRDKIKAKADYICETVKNNGGLYDYLNICDSSNNTPETIDNEFLVLDTHVEPSRGAGRMVERLFIYRTGEMRSTLIAG